MVFAIVTAEPILKAEFFARIECPFENVNAVAAVFRMDIIDPTFAKQLPKRVPGKGAPLCVKIDATLLGVGYAHQHGHRVNRLSKTLVDPSRAPHHCIHKNTAAKLSAVLRLTVRHQKQAAYKMPSPLD